MNPAQPRLLSYYSQLTTRELPSSLRRRSPSLFHSDTRVLLSTTDGGGAIPLTENHHVDARVEAVRLRRAMGGGQAMDSFGEVR